MADPRLIDDVGVARARLDRLAEAGEALAGRSVDAVADDLARACARWADPADPVRKAAEAALADRHGVPPEAVATVLDAAFPRWDRAALLGWADGELGDRRALDGFTPVAGGRRRALGPRLLVALSARGVPTTPVADLLAALLVKAPVWLKPAGDAGDLAARFAATLAAVDDGLGAAVETAGWRSDGAVAGVVLGAADVVAATGDAETMTALRHAVGPRTRLVLHGPRLSVAAIAGEALDADPDGVVAGLADDTAFGGQAGCLSPVAAYVAAPPVRVDELVEPVRAACETRWPGPVRRAAPAAERAAWAEWVALADVERAAGTGGEVAGDADRGWTVRALRRAGAPEPPPVPRALVLASVEALDDVPALLARRRGVVATVGLAAGDDPVGRLGEALAAAGVERVTALGAMQRPPLAWRRDGRPTLADLVRWVDGEGHEKRPAARGARPASKSVASRPVSRDA